jgi:hypothetical protein
VVVVDGRLLVRVVGKPKYTLEEQLMAYDLNKHGGQFFGDGLIESERF